MLGDVVELSVSSQGRTELVHEAGDSARAGESEGGREGRRDGSQTEGEEGEMADASTAEHQTLKTKR